MKVEQIQFLTTQELQEFLGGPGRGPSLRTIQNWRTLGTGPRYLLVSNRAMYRVDDVREWLETEAERTDQKRKERAERQRVRLEAQAKSTFSDPYRDPYKSGTRRHRRKVTR